MIEKIYRNFDWVVVILWVLIIVLPKFPLIPVQGTYVNIRIEDFFVALVYFLWLVGIGLKKLRFIPTNFDKFIFIFLMYGLVVTILGITVFHSVTQPKLGLLSWLREVEYIGIFYIFISTFRLESLLNYIKVIFGTYAFTLLYGLLFWVNIVPGVQTLNSSGKIGTFKDINYVISTFGAHYDFGAFIMMMAVLLMSLYFVVKTAKLKIIIVVSILISVLASYIVFARGAYISMLIVLVFFALTQKSKLWILYTVGIIEVGLAYALGKFSKYSYQFGFVGNPNQSESVVVSQNVPPPLTEPTNSGFFTHLLTHLGVRLDPSSEIRLHAWGGLMDRAGFLMITGQGYSSIGLGADNDYLRHILEIGVLGLLIFAFLIYKFGHTFFQSYRRAKNDLHKYLFLFGIIMLIGLAFNAFVIDVFESSKIAFTFWFLTALLVALSATQTVKLKK